MLKVLMIVSIFAMILSADSAKLGVHINNGEKKAKIVKHKKSSKIKKFRKDHHRYDKRYRDFDYDRYGYYNDDGFYFGFFDRRGYFFNNIYFEYNARYTYNDRLYRRGYFEPRRHHYREYRYHRDNDWNRVHSYREPNVVVYGNYYESSEPRYYRRDRGYVRDYRFSEDRRRDSYRRDHAYRSSSHRYDNDYRRDSYASDYRRSTNRDRGRVVNHRFSTSSSSSRNSGYIRDKKSKSNGRLSITK
ncbi:MAG: hypothetical protein GXO60_02385 [Epsilonproteobacteria bacterium]|nr:hypothetical protein [Campylobacterota bacterium]